MKVEGLNNSVFEMNVSGYMLEHSEGELFSSDWLKGEISISKDGQKIEKTLGLLLIEELEQLKEWLQMSDNYEDCPKRFNFVDPEHGCVLHKRGGKKWVKWIIRVNDYDREFVDMLCEGEIRERVISQLDEILNRYPCRCGKQHETLVECKERVPFSLIYEEYPDIYSLELVPRIFKGGYKDDEELIAGNLYSWLHKTRRILWDTDLKEKRITFFTDPITRLGRRLATLEKIDQDRGEKIMMELVYLLSCKEMYTNDEVRNSELSICNEVMLEIDDPQMKRVLIRFMKMFVEQ